MNLSKLNIIRSLISYIYNCTKWQMVKIRIFSEVSRNFFFSSHRNHRNHGNFIAFGDYVVSHRLHRLHRFFLTKKRPMPFGTSLNFQTLLHITACHQDASISTPARRAPSSKPQRHRTPPQGQVSYPYRPETPRPEVSPPYSSQTPCRWVCAWL